MPANLDNLRNAVDLLDQGVTEHLARDAARTQQAAADLADRDAQIAALKQQIADGGLVDPQLFDQLVSRIGAATAKLK